MSVYSVTYHKSVCTPATVHFARNKAVILHMQRVRMSSKVESTRREVYLGSEEGKGTPLAAHCIPTPRSLQVSTDMPGRYRYGLCTAAASEIIGCVKGDDPQLICSCLTLLPLVAGPGCCIPGGLLQFFRRNSVSLESALHPCRCMLHPACGCTYT